MAVIFNSLKTLVNICQKEGKTLQNYTKRFRVTREVFETQIGGTIAMPQVLKEISGYAEFPTNQDQHEKNKICQDQLFEQLLAYAYLDNADSRTNQNPNGQSTRFYNLMLKQASNQQRKQNNRQLHQHQQIINNLLIRRIPVGQECITSSTKLKT
jgi:hypothetical protein